LPEIVAEQYEASTLPPNGWPFFADPSFSRKQGKELLLLPKQKLHPRHTNGNRPSWNGHAFSFTPLGPPHHSSSSIERDKDQRNDRGEDLVPLSFQTDDHRSMFNGVLPKEQAAPVPRAADPVPRSPPFHLRKFIHSLGSFYFLFLFFAFSFRPQ
jgi:hypothetical protein